ncbi:hypothetical_protein [Leishmania major strain Friedlin]|nr:hypothetical_protein [Leishmania major strain Friedlin]
MNEYLCTSCGTPACLVLSVSPALPSSSTVLADKAQIPPHEGGLLGALPPLVRFCIGCGHELAHRSRAPPRKRSAGSAAVAWPKQRLVAASSSSSEPLVAPTAMVSVATMHAAVVALTRQHQAEKMTLRQELDQLKAVLAVALERHPSLPESERAPVKAVVPAPHSGGAPSFDSDCDCGAHHGRGDSCFSSRHCHTRSPSIVLPASCLARPGISPGEAAGALAATAGNASMLLQQFAPPRCSRTLPRHSCSYDSDIAVSEWAAAADAVAPTQLEARLNSGCRAFLLDSERTHRSALLTPQVPFPVATLRRSRDDGELDSHPPQPDEYARLREALLQQL